MILWHWLILVCVIAFTFGLIIWGTRPAFSEKFLKPKVGPEDKISGDF